MIQTISKQGGRRYTQFRSTISTDAMPISQVGTSAAVVVDVFSGYTIRDRSPTRTIRDRNPKRTIKGQ